MSAPISSSVSIRPVRVGFISTFSMVTSDPDTSSAATSGKAVDDGSPGTSNRLAGELPLALQRYSAHTIRIGLDRQLRTEAGEHLFGCGPRVITGSMTVVMPGALRPASSTADLTCAEAIGTR